MQLLRRRSPRDALIERWLGADLAAGIAAKSRGMRHPVPLANVPGGLWVCDGDYVGLIAGGGFSSLSDLISEATTGGKKQTLSYQKTGVTAPAAAASASLWGVGALPAAGGNAGAAPGGTQFTRTSTGALLQANPGVGDTLHFITWTGVSTVAAMSLLLYDYLWGVNINHATTANAINGTLTRYNGTNAAGNFLSGRVTTVLGAGAHTITVTYVDQDGNAAEAGTAQAVRVSSAVNTTPLTQPQWFYTLNSPDTGMRNLTNIALSAASTGNVDWFIGHPLAILPTPLANVPFILDGINSAFNMEEIKTDACLAFMEYYKGATTATTYSGQVVLVSG